MHPVTNILTYFTHRRSPDVYNTASFRLPKCLCDAGSSPNCTRDATRRSRPPRPLPPRHPAASNLERPRATSSERPQPSADRGAPPQPKPRWSAPRPLVRRGRRGVSDPSLQTQSTDRAYRPSLQSEPIRSPCGCTSAGRGCRPPPAPRRCAARSAAWSCRATRAAA